MYNLKSLLLQLRADYEKLIEQTKGELVAPPNLKLRTSFENGRNYYYVRDATEKEISKQERYLSKTKQYLAQEIASYDYALAINKELDHQIKAIDKAIKYIDPARLTNIYDKMSAGRKELVAPYFISNEEYASKWQAEEVTHKSFADGFFEMYSERGERVRSKSEKIIADKLYKLGVPYRYEASLNLPGVGTIHPDFTVLNIQTREEIYWEHLGMMDNPEYAEKAIERINAYARNNILPGNRLILTFETQRNPLDVKNLERIIATRIQPDNMI